MNEAFYGDVYQARKDGGMKPMSAMDGRCVSSHGSISTVPRYLEKEGRRR